MNERISAWFTKGASLDSKAGLLENKAMSYMRSTLTRVTRIQCIDHAS